MPPAEDPSPKGADPADIAWRGIEHCRQGDWKEGLYWLSLAAENREQGSELPALFYAFLGYGVARYQNKRREGLKLCRRALELEFYQPESYYYLASTLLLLRDRREAFEVVNRGLRVDADFAGLIELRDQLGARRAPVLRFLSRGHFLNRMLGRLRHQLLSIGRKKSEDKS